MSRVVPYENEVPIKHSMPDKEFSLFKSPHCPHNPDSLEYVPGIVSQCCLLGLKYLGFE